MVRAKDFPSVFSLRMASRYLQGKVVSGHHGGEGLVCSQPPQGRSSGGISGPRDPEDSGILSCITWRHQQHRAHPAGAEPSTHWMETHFISWAPRA